MTVPDRDRDLAADVLERVRKILQDGGPLGDPLGIASDDRRLLYAVAHQLYGEGKYALAQHVFAQLVLYDHRDPRHIKGLAAATQMLGDHESAIQMYSVAALMDVSDPTAVMHAGDCFRAMGQHARAAESFGLARAMCTAAKHEPVRRRCDQFLTELQHAA